MSLETAEKLINSRGMHFNYHVHSRYMLRMVDKQIYKPDKCLAQSCEQNESAQFRFKMGLESGSVRPQIFVRELK